MLVGWFVLRSWVLNVVIGFESGAPSVGTVGARASQQPKRFSDWLPLAQKWDSDSEFGRPDKMEAARST
jgi:hypothetical protein